MTITGDGTHLRTYTFVGDIIRANLLAAQSNIADGQAINAGQSTEYTVNEIAEMFGGPVEHTAPRIEPVRNVCGNALAKKLLNWEPTMDLPQWLPAYKKEIGIN
jgi:nucleoside-diphosphate-sugar epimerase